MGTCCRMMEKPADALAYYQEADALQPGNRAVIYHMANCLAEMGEYQEAMDHYFRLDLAEEHSLRAWRCIAWCAFRLGRWDTAQKYHDRIPDQEKTAQDWLNAGHLALVTEGLASAVERYRRADEMMGDHDEFREMLLEDIGELADHGVTCRDLELIADMTL